MDGETWKDRPMHGCWCHGRIFDATKYSTFMGGTKDILLLQKIIIIQTGF